MTNLNLLSLTQRKTLLNALENKETSSTRLKAAVATPNAQILRMVSLTPSSNQSGNLIFGAATTMSTYGTPSDLVTLDGKTCGIAGSGIISDTYLTEVQNKTLESIKTTSSTSTSITYKGKSPVDLHNIKVVIYNLYHKDDNKDTSSTEPETPPTDGPETPPADNPSDPENPSTDPETPPADDGYKSFISTCNGTGATFDTIDEMFSVLSEHGIDTSKGISRADLVKLTQDDTWEDSHWDFFGCLNRIFDVLDGDAETAAVDIYNDGDDGYLTKEELLIFFPDGKIDESRVDYQMRVLEYSQKINEYYQSLSDKDKAQFAIDKTKEYLEVRGMQDQLDSLERLLGQEDYRTTEGIEDSANLIFGNLVFADIGAPDEDGSYNAGVYQYYCTCGSYTGQNGSEYSVALFAEDHNLTTPGYDNLDGSDFDSGITINTNEEIHFFEKPWYMVVDTLVHELTHATAYQYASADLETRMNGTFRAFNKDEVKKLYDDGLISDMEWNQFDGAYTANVQIIEITSSGEVEAKIADLAPLYIKLMYLTSCKWGEYAAYQVDGDFMDSIGGDIFNNTDAYLGNNKWSTFSDGVSYGLLTETYAGGSDTYIAAVETATDGANEQNAITTHIADGYSAAEPLPSYKWWTDGDNGILA